MCDRPYVLEAPSPFYKQLIYKQHPKLAWTNTTRTCVLWGAFKSEIRRWMGTKPQNNPIAPNYPCKSKHLHLVLKMVDYPHCSGHVSGKNDEKNKWMECGTIVSDTPHHLEIFPPLKCRSGCSPPLGHRSWMHDGGLILSRWDLETTYVDVGLHIDVKNNNNNDDDDDYYYYYYYY